MTGRTELIVLEEDSTRGGRKGSGLARKRVLEEMVATGATVRHDSGGRLLVVEISDADADTLRKKPGLVDVAPLDEGAVRQALQVPDLDEQDTLFLRALAIRTSPDYRERKRLRVPGESPEEQLLVTAPCTPED